MKEHASNSPVGLAAFSCYYYQDNRRWIVSVSAKSGLRRLPYVRACSSENRN